MPIFQYQCDKCEKLDDKLVSRAEVDSDAEFPCDCKKKGTLKRTNTISASALRFKGRWFGTTGGY